MHQRATGSVCSISRTRAARGNAMTAVPALASNDEEHAGHALIAAAGKILATEHREVPEDFIAGLFAYAVPEDLMRYDARQLAGLAADAWAHLAVRKAGQAK